MSDIKLFRIRDGAVAELDSQSVAVEKSLQSLIERHLEVFLGVRFLATEYSTGKTHAGRIDTLGIDENGCPVIIEYKRSLNENVINQGLFYLDWLLDHKAEFELLVMRKFGQEPAEEIEWSSPRLLCIAGDFTKYDSHAVQQINRNIELLRYRRYGDEFLVLELVNTVESEVTPVDTTIDVRSDVDGVKPKQVYKTVTESLDDSPQNLKDLFGHLQAFLQGLGDDVQMKTLKYYFAFKRLKNFATAAVYPTAGSIAVWVKLDPASVEMVEGFTRDVSNIGHHGVGDVEISIRDANSLERAKPILARSYEAN
jgi:predicted transport protein